MRYTRRTSGGALAVLMLVAACGDDGMPPDGDSGPPPDDASLDVGSGPALPTIPWLEAGEPPIAAPVVECPAGWREVTSATGVRTCDPYPAEGAADCPEGEAHFPGEPGCAPIGDRCPATGDWPTGLPDDWPIVYVRGGVTGGDGSMASPYPSIGRVRAVVPPPVTIALARGTHVTNASYIVGDMRIIGVCAGGTTLEYDATGWSVNVTGTGNEIRNLTLVGGGILVDGRSAPAEAVIDGVEVRLGRAAGVGLLGDASATVRSLVVRDSRGLSDGSIGAGVIVGEGAGALTLSRAVIEQNRLGGIHVETGGTATIEDVAVRDTDFQLSDGSGGNGVTVRFGATVTVARAMLEDNAWACAIVTEAGSTLSLEDVVCRGAPGRASDGHGGGGVAAIDGAALTVRRAVIERFSNFGVAGAGDPVTVLAEDVVVRDSRGGVLAGLASGIGFDVGGMATLSRVHVESVHGASMFSFTAIDATDVRIVDPLELEGIQGFGVLAGDFSQVSLTRAAIRGARQYGILAQNGGRVELTDVLVADTEGRSLDGLTGNGLALLDGASARAERVVLAANRGGALVGGAGSAGDFTDFVIRDSRPEAASDDFGRGLTVQNDATATLERALLERNRDVGLSVLVGASVTARDLVIRDTLETDCGSECVSWAGGVGIGAYYDATVVVDGIRIERATVCGVQLSDRSSIELRNGDVSGCEIGACVQVPGYDLDRLTDGVLYYDNGANLEVTDLPVPGSLMSIDM